jgi:hypothetical protein
MEWDSTKGEIYDYIPADKKTNPETGEIETVEGEEDKGFPIHEGDVVFKNLSPFDVIFDSTKENFEDNNWILVRTFLNKHDMAAKYPQYGDKIVDLKTKSDAFKQTATTIKKLDETDDIPIYEFFHLPTHSLPNGRYLLYLADDIILMDAPMRHSRHSIRNYWNV